MKNKISFGSWEAKTVLINLIFAQIMLTFPKDMINFGASAGWMIPVAIMLVLLIYFAVAAAMYKNIGNLDLVDISEKIGGRTLKVIAGLLISILLIINIAIYLGGFSQTLKQISLDKSPLGYVEVIFILGMTAAAYFGIEAVARINSFLVPVIITIFIIITIGVIPKFNFNNLFPLMGEGLVKVAEGSFLRMSVFFPLLILFFMVPFFKKQQVKRVGFTSILISGLLLIWSTLAFLLVFPYQIAVSKSIPIFQIARYMEIGNANLRVESFSVLISSLSSLLYLGVLFTFLIYILEKTLSLSLAKPIILPMAAIILTLSDISKKLNFDLINTGMINYFWLAGMLLPIIILIIGAAKKVGVDRKGGNQDD